MGKAKFWPPGALKPLNGFRWNLEYITRSRVCPHTQIHVALQQRVWSGRTREFCGFLGIPFLLYSNYSSAHAEPTQVDRFWRSRPIRHTTCFRQRMCLLGSRLYCSPFGGKIPKTPILGAWIGIFKLNVQNIKNLHTVEISAPIKTKFCTVTKTTKYSSWVDPTRVKQIQDGGRPPSWKMENRP